MGSPSVGAFREGEPTGAGPAQPGPLAGLGGGGDDRLVIDVSPIQLLLVLAIALVVLGPRRLPQLGRDLGRGLRQFRAGLIADDERDPGVAGDGPEGEWTGPDPVAGREVPREPGGPA